MNQAYLLQAMRLASREGFVALPALWDTLVVALHQARQISASLYARTNRLKFLLARRDYDNARLELAEMRTIWPWAIWTHWLVLVALASGDFGAAEAWLEPGALAGEERLLQIYLRAFKARLQQRPAEALDWLLGVEAEALPSPGLQETHLRSLADLAELAGQYERAAAFRERLPAPAHTVF